MSSKNNRNDTKKELFSDFGTRLKQEAQSKFGGVGKLAKIVGIKQTQLSRYIKGQNLPVGKILFKLSNAGISIDYLFTGNKLESNESINLLLSKYGFTDLTKLEKVLKLYCDFTNSQ